jgi:hypothetical protein
VNARRGEAEEHVARLDGASVHDLGLVDHPDDGADQVNVGVSVDVGHLGHLSSHEGTVVLPARRRKAAHHGLRHAGVERAGAHVVEKIQRPGPAHRDVVHAVVHQVLPHRVVALGPGGHLHLRADPVDRGDEHGPVHVAHVELEEGPEGPDVREDARGEGLAHHRANAVDGLVAGLNVDARVFVGGHSRGEIVRQDEDPGADQRETERPRRVCR